MLTPTAPPVTCVTCVTQAHAMGHDVELVQVFVLIEHLAWHISTGLIARLHPHMKTCSLHHLREREEQLKLHQYLDLQRLVALDQEVLCHVNDGALLVPPCLYNPDIVTMDGG